MNHKKKRCKNRRAGCLLCKPWKANGTPLKERSRYGDYKKEVFAEREVEDTMKTDPTEA